MKEKCSESIHAPTGETLKRDLQDLAMLESRAVGESTRAVLELHVQAAKGRLKTPDREDQARSAPERY